KQAVRQIGSFSYHFWMRDMKPLRRNNGNQHLHRESLSQYLSATFPAQVWSSFGSWVRTIRPGIPPSELVVAPALRHTLPTSLATSAQHISIATFIVDRQDPDRMDMFRLAG